MLAHWHDAHLITGGVISVLAKLHKHQKAKRLSWKIPLGLLLKVIKHVLTLGAPKKETTTKEEKNMHYSSAHVDAKLNNMTVAVISLEWPADLDTDSKRSISTIQHF